MVLISTPASPLEQYEKFIGEPINTLQLIGEVILVIDALDECEDRQEIIEALSKSDLPPNIRFIVTTRR
jgi:hypothetical protein